MKANAAKRKVFQDAVDLLGMPEEVNVPASNGQVMIPVEKIVPFHNHPFRLYQGERLDDMVESIREHGVLIPVIVQKVSGKYEMLAGYNRWNAAKIAGVSEIPAIVKEGLSEEEAYACAFQVREDDLEGRVCYGGLDLSSTTDITAFVLVFPPRDGIYGSSFWTGI